MQVRATQKGYYDGKLRHVGEVFSLANEADFSIEWMEAKDKAFKPKPRPVLAAVPQNMASALARIAQLEQQLAAIHSPSPPPAEPATGAEPAPPPAEPAPPPAPEPAPTAGKPGRPPKATPAEPAET